jgi:hypothetical protein
MAEGNYFCIRETIKEAALLGKIQDEALLEF